MNLERIQHANQADQRENHADDEIKRPRKLAFRQPVLRDQHAEQAADKQPDGFRTDLLAVDIARNAGNEAKEDEPQEIVRVTLFHHATNLQTHTTRGSAPLRSNTEGIGWWMRPMPATPTHLPALAPLYRTLSSYERGNYTEVWEK